MQIYGFQKTTLLDFPGKVACTVFTGSCDFRCPFCHNKSLVLDPLSVPLIPETKILSQLEKRRGILDGVCITGGEPTLQPDLGSFLQKIRRLGFAVKLDTNGYHPAVLKHLVQEGLLDYVAMDIKQCQTKYHRVSQNPPFELEQILDSVSFLMEGNVSYEFRTTVVRELHTKEDFIAIGNWIKGASSYYLQPYQESENVITPGFSSYSYREMQEIQSLLLPSIPTFIRGMEEA